MTPADVIREMRKWADRDYPQIGAWADTLEAAMREKDAEIEWLKNDLETAERALDAQTDFRKEIERLNQRIENCQTAKRLHFARKDAEIERLREALESIAANTCCDKCQEAALVARAALASTDPQQ